MTCFCDLEAPAVIDETWRTARKAHTCCECRRAITPGERYQEISGLWDGDWRRYRTCEACADLRESLEQVWCVPLGGLRLAYMDWLGESDKKPPANHLTRPELIRWRTQ